MAKSGQMKTLLHNLFSFRRKNVYVKISANNQITGLQCDKKKLKEMRDGNVEKSTIDRKWDIFSCQPRLHYPSTSLPNPSSNVNAEIEPQSNHKIEITYAGFLSNFTGACKIPPPPRPSVVGPWPLCAEGTCF